MNRMTWFWVSPEMILCRGRNAQHQASIFLLPQPVMASILALDVLPVGNESELVLWFNLLCLFQPLFPSVNTSAHPSLYIFCRPFSPSSLEISSVSSLPPPLSLSLSCSLSFCLLSFLSFLIFFTLAGTAAALRVEGLWLGRGENWLWDRQTQNWVIIVCVWEACSPDEKLQDKRSKWHSIQRQDVSGLQIMLNPSFT